MNDKDRSDPQPEHGKGPPRRKGETRRPGSRQGRSGPHVVVGAHLRAVYEGQLGGLREAYPSLKVLGGNEEGMWLSVRSEVISDLGREATFVVFLPLRSGARICAWGFWDSDGEIQWIGPRHTNFDGSICAFSRKDQVWTEGGDLRTLLDLYTVWALRHLYLEAFDGWPGRQSALEGVPPDLQAFYRRTQCRDNELCGCGSATRRYSECCKPWDVKLDIVELSVRFLKVFPKGFAGREAPPALWDFMQGRSDCPSIADVCA